MLETLIQNLQTMSDSPSSMFAMLGVLLLIFFCMYARRIKFSTRMLVYISLMLAVTILLQQIRLYHFPQGGSVTLGSMVPLMLLTYRYGASVGMFAGFIFGLINIILDPFILHPIQVLFDYPLPQMAVGLAALYERNIIVSTFLVFTGKFVCHFISGVVFFASYAPEGTSPIIYSLTVNGMKIVPEFLICCVLLKILPVQRLIDAMDKNRG